MSAARPPAATRAPAAFAAFAAFAALACTRAPPAPAAAAAPMDAAPMGAATSADVPGTARVPQDAAAAARAPAPVAARRTRLVSHIVNGQVAIEEVVVEDEPAAAAPAAAAPTAASSASQQRHEVDEVDPHALQKLLAAADAERDLDARIDMLDKGEKALPAVFTARSRAVVFAAIGDAYELQNDGLHALYAYEKAADANPAYEKRLADIRKKQSVEKYFTAIRNDHFAGMFEGDADKELAEGALQILDDAYKTLGDRLGVTPATQVTVIFYTGDKFDQAVTHFDWTGGIFDGKIRVSKNDWHMRRGAVRDLLWHEYTHSLVRALPVGVPVWFNEGLAQHEEENRSRFRVGQLKQPGGRKRIPSLAVLSGRGFYGSGMSDAAGADIGYACGLDLVDFLTELRGESSLKDLMGALQEQKSFDDAVADVYGLSMAQLESKWRDRFAE